MSEGESCQNVRRAHCDENGELTPLSYVVIPTLKHLSTARNSTRTENMIAIDMFY